MEWHCKKLKNPCNFPFLKSLLSRKKNPVSNAKVYPSTFITIYIMDTNCLNVRDRKCGVIFIFRSLEMNNNLRYQCR